MAIPNYEEYFYDPKTISIVIQKPPDSNSSVEVRQTQVISSSISSPISVNYSSHQVSFLQQLITELTLVHNVLTDCSQFSTEAERDGSGLQRHERVPIKSEPGESAGVYSGRIQYATVLTLNPSSESHKELDKGEIKSLCLTRTLSQEVEAICHAIGGDLRRIADTFNWPRQRPRRSAQQVSNTVSPYNLRVAVGLKIIVLLPSVTIYVGFVWLKSVGD